MPFLYCWYILSIFQMDIPLAELGLGKTQVSLSQLVVNAACYHYS